MTTPDYKLQEDAVQAQGRRVSIETWTDISPEMVLMMRLSLSTKAIKAGVSQSPKPMPASWRKRMAHVTET